MHNEQTFDQLKNTCIHLSEFAIYLAYLVQRTTNYTLQRKYRLSQDTGMPISPNYGTEKSFAHMEIYLPLQLD